MTSDGQASVDAPRRVTFRPAAPYLLLRDAEVPGQDSTDLGVGEAVAVGGTEGVVRNAPVVVRVGDLVLYRQERADSIVVDEEPLWLVEKAAVVGVFE